MSSIRELIAKMKKEDEERQKADEKHFAEHDKKYKEMSDRISIYEDRLKKGVQNIHQRVQQLINHKHSIDKALQEMDDLPGLPLPYEEHSNFVKFVSEVHGVLNKPDILDRPSTLSVEEIQNDVTSTTESIASDLKEFKTEFIQAVALHHNTNELKKLDRMYGK
ncbi:uncharacterized protein LOC106642692 isoform X2 [Copidosoma floridanum]|uniref:uncharacterized protein LOC106642692 isoform X2 n=1 Tax=Copidosoma floridanum TaxID=29053 RepID=UPI0006C96550|nr:uncharacterized protein LOC106642692 isoform X2 [Copidosoma floridanum]